MSINLLNSTLTFVKASEMPSKPLIPNSRGGRNERASIIEDFILTSGLLGQSFIRVYWGRSNWVRPFSVDNILRWRHRQLDEDQKRPAVHGLIPDSSLRRLQQ